MADRNFLSPINFKFVINRMPNLEYYVQQVNIPNISLGVTANVPSPFGQNPLHGDKLEYGQLTCVARIDEDMDVYLEMHEWLRGIASPLGFDGYEELKDAREIYSDGSLIIQNNSMNPSVEVTYYDLFPVSIGDINFNATDGDVPAMTCDMTFAFRYFEIRKVT